MGVWIETSGCIGYEGAEVSHPVWVCGLKLLHANTIHLWYNVTPCMGVWIETKSFTLSNI